LEKLLLHDPLEPWAVWELDRLRGGDGAAFASQHRNDAQIVLDIAFDYISVGAFQRAEDLLEWHLRTGVTPVATPHPLSRTQSAAFTLAWMKHLQKDSQAAREMIEKAGEQCADYFFPSRLEEQLVLEWVGSVSDAWLPRYGIGNYYYDKRRHQDAIRVWEEAASKEAPCATVHRNLGIAYWNCGRDGGRARAAYEAALRLDPDD